MDETIDLNLTEFSGGNKINPAALPLDPKNKCRVFYPHMYPYVNNIFEVCNLRFHLCRLASHHRIGHLPFCK